MNTGRTTIAVQCYLDELAGMGGDSPAEPIVRALLARSVDRLHVLCSSLLHRSYPRLTRGPLNLQSEETLGAVVERLIKAMREVRPQTVRQFFALANKHVRWELNDLARRLDERAATAELHESRLTAPAEPGSLRPEPEPQPDSLGDRRIARRGAGGVQPGPNPGNDSARSRRGDGGVVKDGEAQT